MSLLQSIPLKMLLQDLGCVMLLFWNRPWLSPQGSFFLGLMLGYMNPVSSSFYFAPQFLRAHLPVTSWEKVHGSKLSPWKSEHVFFPYISPVPLSWKSFSFTILDSIAVEKLAALLVLDPLCERFPFLKVVESFIWPQYFEISRWCTWVWLSLHPVRWVPFSPRMTSPLSGVCYSGRMVSGPGLVLQFSVFFHCALGDLGEISSTLPPSLSVKFCFFVGGFGAVGFCLSCLDSFLRCLVILGTCSYWRVEHQKAIRKIARVGSHGGCGWSRSWVSVSFHLIPWVFIRCLCCALSSSVPIYYESLCFTLLRKNPSGLLLRQREVLSHLAEQSAGEDPKI